MQMTGTCPDLKEGHVGAQPATAQNQSTIALEFVQRAVTRGGCNIMSIAHIAVELNTALTFQAAFAATLLDRLTPAGKYGDSRNSICFNAAHDTDRKQGLMTCMAAAEGSQTGRSREMSRAQCLQCETMP